MHPLFYSGKCGHCAQTIGRFGTHEETLAEIRKFAAADKVGSDDPLFFWGLGESEFGSITVGKSADFIVLDRDILSIDKREIDKARVVETYFRGSRVYHA